MAQAKTLTISELEQVLRFTQSTKHAVRNRALVAITNFGGLRAGEVAALRVCDVCDTQMKVKSEIRLLPEYTKGKHARTVFVSEKLQGELQAYAETLKVRDLKQAFFYTQKNPKRGFTPNSLVLLFKELYKDAGISGASSHSGRRSFITNLASKGIGVRVLMSLAGHKNISTTQAYIDVNDDMKRRAVELI